jgi:hypothetical protein
VFTPRRTFTLLPLLACLLTVAASGDDFCLARLALPTLFAGADVLPLDDPNTDALVPDGPAAPLPWGADLAGPCPGALGLVPAGPPMPPDPACAAALPLPRAELRWPLRC